MAKKIRENRKKTSLAEGFLDGEEDVNVTPEDTQPEAREDDAVEGEEELADEPADDEEHDISDDPSEDDEPTESDDDDELDDADEGGEDDGERQEDLQDTMQSLITAVQALTDQINKQKASDDGAAENDSAEEDAPVEDDEITDDSADEESEGEETADDDSDAEYEGDDADETSEEETSDEGEETSDEETDETKSEAWNHYAKFGKLLHEKSGSLIGMLQHNRFDALEPCIMAVVESKIHDRVEGAKKEFRMEAYNRKFSEQ